MLAPTSPHIPDWVAKALDFASCGITVADATIADTPLIYVNRAFEAMTGYTSAELIGRNCRFLQGSDRDQPERHRIQRAMADGREVTVVLRNYRKDGTLFLNELHLSPVFDERGLTHFVGIQMDVTLQLDRERRLQEEEARHRALLNSSLDAVITIDTSGIIQSVNPATEVIFGYGSDELVGRNVQILMPEPWRSEHPNYIRRYLETGRAHTIGRVREMSGYRKDGTQFPIELTVTAVTLAQGTVFKGIVRDISKRKAAEALASNTLEQLKRSQENLLVLLNQFRVVTLLLRGDGRVEFISRSCDRFAGVDRVTAVGRPWDQVLPLPSSAREQLQRQLTLPPGQRHRITLHWNGPDGKETWVECDVRDDPQEQGRHILLLDDVTEIHQLRQAIEESRYGRMVGDSEAMRELFRRIDDVARGDWTVLIEGETGVGKELVAHAIHAASRRKNGPFITVNSAGLSESLLASQLFGHRKGAFTGAVKDQEGFFEAAQGGTLFLDEIGDLPLSMQASLLRALQEKEITRLGETRLRKVDVRILAASHKDVAEEVSRGRFREDLLYRLRVARLRVPALRERKSDIPLLAEAFFAQSYRLSSRAQPRFGREAMQRLLDYSWPGNVRELKACVDYSVIHCQGERIGVRDLPPELQEEKWSESMAPPAIAGDERERILAALKNSGGNRQRAAKLLGISRATLYRRLAEYGLSLRH